MRGETGATFGMVGGGTALGVGALLQAVVTQDSSASPTATAPLTLVTDATDGNRYSSDDRCTVSALFAGVAPGENNWNSLEIIQIGESERQTASRFSKLSNFAKRSWKNSSRLPIGPFLCLLTRMSAMPFRSVAGSYTSSR